MNNNRRPPQLQYPWRTGNRVTLLVDGNTFFPHMLASIATAKSYILLEMYLFESGSVADRFIDALCDAAQRGVGVYLLLDDFGVHGLHNHDRQRLTASNVKITYYNPIHYQKWNLNLHRDHRKLLLVDGRIAYTGGAGLTDEFDPPHNPQQRWHETMVACEGPVVADWQHSFQALWAQWAPQPLSLPPPMSAEQPDNLLCRLTLSHTQEWQGVKRALVTRIRNAQQRVWIATAYFIPTWKSRRALKKAAQHGVDVRLLLPGPITDHPAIRHIGRRYYHRLLRNGVRIYEYQPRFIHSKIMLCDDWVSTGSTNLDRWTQRWNLEANLETKNHHFAEIITQQFLSDFEHCREYRYEEWVKRPWHRRLLESFWGVIQTWVEHLSQLQRRRLPEVKRKK